MMSIAFVFFIFLIYSIHNNANALPMKYRVVKGVNNHCIQQQSKKFTTLFMQLNSASDLNSDMKEYIFVRDAERRQQEALKNSINDIKEIIKENFKSLKDDMKSVKDDMTKMEAKLDKITDDTKTIFKSVKDDMTKMEAKVDKITDDTKKINVALFVGFLVLVSIQPDVRSLVSIIIKLINI